MGNIREEINKFNEFDPKKAIKEQEETDSDNTNDQYTWGQVKEFGRNAFYRGREWEDGKFPRCDYIFKRPTYYEYLRELGGNETINEQEEEYGVPKSGDYVEETPTITIDLITDGIIKAAKEMNSDFNPADDGIENEINKLATQIMKDFTDTIKYGLTEPHPPYDEEMMFISFYDDYPEKAKNLEY